LLQIIGNGRVKVTSLLNRNSKRKSKTQEVA
jgi:hypothetical protein